MIKKLLILRFPFAIMMAFALVAQLDRVPGYEPGGQRFESSPVRSFSTMKIDRFPSGPLKTNSYLIYDDSFAAVIDPSMGSFEKILQRATDLRLVIQKIILTHSHWDHIVDAKIMKEETESLLYVHALDAKNVEFPGSDLLPLPVLVQGVSCDHLLEDGDLIEIGTISLKVIHTPGHSPGSICLYSEKEKILFSGDTLFCSAIGRTDLPTGNPKIMHNSLEKLALLPKDTLIFPGHGPQTTIAKEFY